jgi:integrase
MGCCVATIEKRESEDGEVAYRVKVRLKGFPSQNATFKRITDAKKWAQATEAAIREGRYFKTSEARKHSLADAIERYFEDVLRLNPKKNDANQRLYLKWWKEQLGAYTLADVNPSLIVEQRNKLVGQTNRFKRTIGTTTANRYTTALSHVFTIAINEWEWLESNPIARVSKLKEPRGRVRFLSDEERTALLEQCTKSENPYLHTVVVLALSTGARKMEIMSLKWVDVDFQRKSIVLHETKNNERRVLPLQGYALELMQKLAQHKKAHSDFVFPSEKGDQPVDIRRAWEYAVEKTDIKDFKFHDLRHSAASYLAMNGASLAEIAEVLGHKTLQMVKRYAHLSEAHTSAVVARMNERIFGNGVG